MTLAEVIARLDVLAGRSTIYTESFAPSARAYVARDARSAAEVLPYVLNVAAAQAALGRRAPGCPWRRRAIGNS